MNWLKIPYRAAWRLVMVDEGLELSGYIAFAAFLSLFPFLIFLAALAGFLGDRQTANEFVQSMFHFMPKDVAETLAPAAVRALVKALTGEPDWRRPHAAVALGQVGSPAADEAIPALEKALEDPAVEPQARWALEMLGQ